MFRFKVAKNTLLFGDLAGPDQGESISLKPGQEVVFAWYGQRNDQLALTNKVEGVMPGIVVSREDLRNLRESGYLQEIVF